MSIEDPQTVPDAAPRPNFVFAAPADDPRARRPADGLSLALSVLVALWAAWAYASDTDTDRRILSFFAEGNPSWLSGVFTIVYIVGGLYAIGLLFAIWIFGKGRGAVVRDMFAAGGLAIVVTTGLSALAGPEWPDILPELLERDGRPSYPVIRLAFSVAVVAVASPYLTVPMRRVGRRLVVGMAVAALVMSYGLLSAIIGAIAVGTGVASAVHLVFGSGIGIPSATRIMDALRSIGLDPVTVQYLDDQPVGATLLKGELGDGTEVSVKVFGRDAADAATVSRVWRSMWYRDHDRALTASGLQQVEHESLMLHEGRLAGLPVPDLIGWGRGESGDALIVTRWLDGDRLEALSAEDMSDVILRQCWEAITELQEARIAHGNLDRHQVVVLEDRVVLEDLQGARISPDATTRAVDVAQMLVVTALVVGSERAISAARAAVGDDQLRDALPVLQSTALPSSLQRDLKESDLSLKGLRRSMAESIDVEEPELVQLARVTWGSVVMVGLTLIAAYALISSLADIGFDTIVEEISNAEWAWIVIAFVFAQLSYAGDWLALTGVVQNRVPFGPTIMFQYALKFITLAVPADAGAIAMNIRYMRRLGESTAAAVAQGPLLTLFTKGIDIVLLLITGQVIRRTVALDDIDSGPVLRLLLLACAAIVIGIIVVFAVPKLRAKLVPSIKEALRATRASISDPERLLRVFAGSLAQRILYALALSASVAAYGGSLPFAEAVFVNSAISLFVGLMPVPGGVGVGEAALTAGLTAVGVPETAAVAAAITHRMLSAYLPPVFGWYASRWLSDRDYL